jgi:hypothetical protein
MVVRVILVIDRILALQSLELFQFSLLPFVQSWWHSDYSDDVSRLKTSGRSGQSQEKLHSHARSLPISFPSRFLLAWIKNS